MGKSGCIRAKILDFGQTGCIWAKVVVFRKVLLFGQNWLYAGKRCSIRAKVVVFGQKWSYSGKLVVFEQSGCIREGACIWPKVVVFGQNWLYSGIVVVFGQGRCIRAEWLYSGESGCIRAK